MIGGDGRKSAESRERELGVWDNEAWAKAILFASYSNLILEHGITAWGNGKLTAMAGIQEMETVESFST